MNQYSPWHYALIFCLIILGIIYALPNLYGDDPAIQISAKDGTPVPAQVATAATQALKKGDIPFISIKSNEGSYLIRLNKENDQSRAQDLIQIALGANVQKFSVALNLAPRTPQWLRNIGAQPMKLGLDLRGGIHFLMQIDVDTMMKDQIKGDIRAVGDDLRSAMIRYASLAQSGSNGILIRFTTEDARNNALTALQGDFNTYTFLPKQSGDLYSIQMTMPQQVVQQLKNNAIQQNRLILDKRIKALGISDPVIAQQGSDQISVDLPGIQDTARAKAQLNTVAKIQLQLQDQFHDAAAAARTGVVPFGDTLYTYDGPSNSAMKKGDKILLRTQPILSGSSITSASPGVDQGGRPAVNISVGGSGLSYFNKMTAENIGKPLAVVYVQTNLDKKLVDGKIKLIPTRSARVINVATIQSALGRSFQIMGLASQTESQNLSLQLQSGAYSAPMAFIAEEVVGPSMGQQNIAMGIKACEIGSLMVFIFMLCYYRVFGLVADFALVLNIIFVVALQSVMSFTMTLPGIAALVLTVGMAVDANVLIDERIREELRLGMSPQAAISAGYARAFTTIIDANVTTLIVAMVLYALGTGPVQGFAITLAIGILTSMVTAIFFTRGFINLIYGRRKQLKQLSIGITVKSQQKAN